ncbi:MAG TPA: hypothetical protein VG106_02410, partial [Vicinamibacterales bacterium]|nr:hypothetical protein [Vicinamibacterales bacterium]
AVTRYRDYTATGRIVVIVGALLSFMCLGLPGIPFGIGAMYFAVKGRRQRKDEGRSVTGPILVFLVGLLELLGGFLLFAFFIWGLTRS